jgi:hypothetical protein
VAATQQSDLTRLARLQAGTALHALQHEVTIKRQSGTTYLVASSGYLPGHPVILAVDGSSVATLTATSAGTVSGTFDASTIGRGVHKVTLTSMLITETGTFRG